MRGSRGWGSAAPYPGPCGESTIVGLPEDFQQNPCHVLDWVAAVSDVAYGGESSETLEVIELEEAGADMFLNWAYRILNEGGFENASWPIGCTEATECLDNRGITPGSDGPGDDRYNWMSNIMTAFFDYYAWW